MPRALGPREDCAPGAAARNSHATNARGHAPGLPALSRAGLTAASGPGPSAPPPRAFSLPPWPPEEGGYTFIIHRCPSRAPRAAEGPSSTLPRPEVPQKVRINGPRRAPGRAADTQPPTPRLPQNCVTSPLRTFTGRLVLRRTRPPRSAERPRLQLAVARGNQGRGGTWGAPAGI